MHRSIQTFFDLVRIDSPTGEEKALVEFLITKLQTLGLSVSQDKYGNVYARLDGDSEGIFFSAHMDTVEPGRGIHPKIYGEYLVSDGKTILGADDKIAIAAILEAIPVILSQSHKTVELVFTCSEEVGNYGAMEFDYNLLQAKNGYCFDLSQPVGTITIASPFYERFDITLMGRSAHASHPEEAINVLPALSEILQIAPLGKADEDTFFNIGVVDGGDVRNTILGSIMVKGEIRSFTAEGLSATKESFRKNVAKIATKYGINTKEEWVWENPGYKHISEKSRSFITDTEKLIKEIGLKSIITQTAGVSDANIFNDKGLLCLNLGNGGEFAHTTKERIKISELENLIQLMVALVTG